MQLCDNLKMLRQSKGWSQEQLAETMQISRQAIAKWESGTAQPELEKLMQLAALYQVSLDDMLCGAKACERSTGCNPPGNDWGDLISFLLLATANTYAGKAAEDSDVTCMGSHDFVYRAGDYGYRDRYWGGERFAGEEALFIKEVCVWAMNYCGRTINAGFSGDFLKAALLFRPRENPYRGPQLYRDGRFTYHNQTQGSFEWFQGMEMIYRDEMPVFECVYHGGSIRA